ncbi:DNA-directed DNA polymerase [Tanacetum coccineum]
MDPVIRCTTLPSHSRSLKGFLFHFSWRSTHFYRLSHSELDDIEKVALCSSLRLLKTKCARLIKILRVLRIILEVLPEHPSDTKVLTMKMEILLEPTSNKLLWIFNSLVHSLRALSTLRRSGLRTASATAKPCQGDSLEFYLITDPIIAPSSPSFTPFEGGDFILEEIETFLRIPKELSNLDDDYYDTEEDILYLEKLLSEDPSLNLPPMKNDDLKQIDVTMTKPSIEEPPELKLKDLPSHLEYAFLEGTDKLPVIISKELKEEEKAALLKVLKSHKWAIAWKISDIKGIDPSFCTHKILMEDDFKPAVQHQRRVNPKIHEVIKKEVIKLLDAGLIYPIFDSLWVSPVYCVPKKGGMTVVENEDNELIPTRLVTGWRVCIDYRKLNDATRKDHFPLPFMDQMLERLAGNGYYCFLDGFSRYFQIPIDPQDQEKTTFTCPYRTFAYRRMPFGLCNAPGTFQRCMMAIFHDMIEETMEVFMDDFSVFGDSFSSCLSHLDKMLKRVQEEQDGKKRYKARFVVKSFQQKRGVDYNEIFSPVTKMTTIRLVLSIVAAGAFYVGALNDTSTQHKSEGFQLTGQEENLECRLKEILYGLIQAPRLRVLIFVEDSWNEEPCSDVHQVGDEIEVEVLRSFNWPPSELITEDGFLPERGYSQFNDVSSGYLDTLYRKSPSPAFGWCSVFRMFGGTERSYIPYRSLYRALTPAKTTVRFGGIRNETSSVYLEQPWAWAHEEAPTHAAPTTRKDGWMEIEFGEFYHDDADEGDVEIRFQEHITWKRGLIVEGIELRPK